MAELLEIRIGGLREHTEIRATIADGKKWPREISTGWIKSVVSGPVKTALDGLVDDHIGAPSHLEDTFNRGVLVFCDQTYDLIREVFPESAATLVRGGFGENFVVNDPSLLPSVVCVGDKFQIGSSLFHVSGARHACMKVDAWHNANGMTALTVANGWAGYFLRVDKEGEVCAGDKIILLERPHPGWTIERISRGLWGSAEQVDNSREFLEGVSGLEELIPRYFRETAQMRLQRLNEKEQQEPAVSPSMVTTKPDSRVMYLTSLLIALLCVFLYAQFGVESK